MPPGGRDVLRGTATVSPGYRLRSADGSYRWILVAGVPRYDSHGEFAGYIGSCVDITEHRQAEQALHDSEERYALATAAGAVGVWDWNLETNHFYVDPQINRLLGYDAADAPNSADDWKARLHVDDRQLLARVRECIDTRTDSFELEHRLAHRDGGLRWCVAKGTVMRRPDGSPFRIVGTEIDITERKRAEEAIRENEAGLRASHSEIQHLAGRLIAAQETERTRIARDLHDDVSQQLAGLSISLSTLKRDIREGDVDVRAEIALLQQRTIALADNVRRLSHDLHPGVLHHAGLVSVLSAHCADLRRLHPLVVHFSTTDDFETLDRDDALCLYRVAQESLRNVITHSGATHADVRLTWVGQTVQLTISDDGKGFDAVETRRTSTGLGLVSISERVRLAGGSASIATELNKGTRIQVVIPAKGAHPPGKLGDGRSDLSSRRDVAAS